jgi:hypothetical protein
LIGGILFFASGLLWAADKLDDYSIETAMMQPEAKSKLGGEISYYFGDQAHPEIEKSYGVFKTSQRTNGFGKSDEVACNWVFLSAMIVLHNRAIAEGGDAIINIKSNFNNVETSSETSFRCANGAIMAGVALTGEVVKLKQ